MKKILILLAAATLSFAACDKIEHDNYLIFAGQSGIWEDGTGVENPIQRVLLEKYTGVRCSNCPAADDVITTALEKYNGQLVAVSIHDSGAFTRPYAGDPDLRTEQGNIWSEDFGIFGGTYPSAMVNRTSTNGSFNIFDPIGGVNSHIDPYIGQTPSVGIAVNSQMQDNNALIVVDLEFLQDITAPTTLTVLVMEDSIITKQSRNEKAPVEYAQNHVLRTVITDVYGTPVDADGMTGTKRKVTYLYEPKAEWNLDNCHIVAFISDRDTKEVLNVAECKLK